MDDSGFDSLISDVYKKLDQEYKFKVETIMIEQGLSKGESQERSKRTFLTKRKETANKKIWQATYKNVCH